MTTLAKICGFTRADEAAHAAGLGADFLGLNFWPRSRRFVATDLAADLAAAARAARPGVAIVGLFVDPLIDDVAAVHARLGLDVVQLHGDEHPDLVAALCAAGLTVWKAHAVSGAVAIARLADWPADAHLLDAPSAGRGGSGTTFDWALAAAATTAGHRIVLAGGLTPANVAAAIAATTPYAVDVASGVERAPGLKDPALVEAFLAAVRWGQVHGS